MQVPLDGPGEPDPDRAAVRSPAPLADDVTDGRDDLVQCLLGYRAALMARRRDRGPDVLLVHPAIEDPDPHEPGVGGLAGRGPRRGVELLRRHSPEAGQPL